MTPTFEVDEEVIVYAFRYALGIKSTAVSNMSAVLFNNWNRLRDFTKTKIKEEIEDAILRDCAGMDCDVIEWQKILRLE